jgi:hypothetical protein
VTDSHPFWIRRWPLITLVVWVAFFCLAMLLRMGPPSESTRESLEPRTRQPLLSEPPPVPSHVHHPWA